MTNKINRQKKSRKKGIGGFRFPKEPTLQVKWRVAMNRINLNTNNLGAPSLHSKVCHEHFKKEDYDRPGGWDPDVPRLPTTNLKYKSQLSPLDECVLTLVKLRRNTKDFEFARVFFCVSEVTAVRVFQTWLAFLYIQLQEYEMWPSKEVVKQHMPKDFKTKFPVTWVVLDATKIAVEKPKNVPQQVAS
ncbi:unnamed protein product [Lepeophtheirus salmonis]|uniref:(salmon louse) hypothetical protein n=1 Tax=Lepeophtheirus salmonis TaxID=72036 RepID=A0A7R8CBD9_LEPSM|nr:unnamed protein product [Lepeophtheirus salmonis]CAF2759421.1 unnamed protein product [Lepeophtheirus salmonis]